MGGPPPISGNARRAVQQNPLLNGFQVGQTRFQFQSSLNGKLASTQTHAVQFPSHSIPLSSPNLKPRVESGYSVPGSNSNLISLPLSRNRNDSPQQALERAHFQSQLWNLAVQDQNSYAKLSPGSHPKALVMRWNQIERFSDDIMRTLSSDHPEVRNNHLLLWQILISEAQSSDQKFTDQLRTLRNQFDRISSTKSSFSLVKADPNNNQGIYSTSLFSPKAPSKKDKPIGDIPSKDKAIEPMNQEPWVDPHDKDHRLEDPDLDYDPPEHDIDEDTETLLAAPTDSDFEQVSRFDDENFHFNIGNWIWDHLARRSKTDDKSVEEFGVRIIEFIIIMLNRGDASEFKDQVEALGRRVLEEVDVSIKGVWDRMKPFAPDRVPDIGRAPKTREAIELTLDDNLPPHIKKALIRIINGDRSPETAIALAIFVVYRNLPPGNYLDRHTLFEIADQLLAGRPLDESINHVLDIKDATERRAAHLIAAAKQDPLRTDVALPFGGLRLVGHPIEPIIETDATPDPLLEIGELAKASDRLLDLLTRDSRHIEEYYNHLITGKNPDDVDMQSIPVLGLLIDRPAFERIDIREKKAQLYLEIIKHTINREDTDETLKVALLNLYHSIENQDSPHKQQENYNVVILAVYFQTLPSYDQDTEHFTAFLLLITDPETDQSHIFIWLQFQETQRRKAGYGYWDTLIPKIAGIYRQMNIADEDAELERISKEIPLGQPYIGEYERLERRAEINRRRREIIQRYQDNVGFPVSYKDMEQWNSGLNKLLSTDYDLDLVFELLNMRERFGDPGFVNFLFNFIEFLITFHTERFNSPEAILQVLKRAGYNLEIDITPPAEDSTNEEVYQHLAGIIGPSRPQGEPHAIEVLWILKNIIELKQIRENPAIYAELNRHIVRIETDINTALITGQGIINTNTGTYHKPRDVYNYTVLSEYYRRDRERELKQPYDFVRGEFVNLGDFYSYSLAIFTEVNP